MTLFLNGYLLPPLLEKSFGPILLDNPEKMPSGYFYYVTAFGRGYDFLAVVNFNSQRLVVSGAWKRVGLG